MLRAVWNAEKPSSGNREGRPSVQIAVGNERTRLGNLETRSANPAERGEVYFPVATSARLHDPSSIPTDRKILPFDISDRIDERLSTKKKPDYVTPQVEI